jgi:Skp family chaperone for outer membrane proteins
MKNSKTLLLFMLLFVAQTISAQSLFEKWPPINSFHEVIAQTFHPSEEGNLKPIKERSGELLTKAKALTSEAIPAEYKTDTILASIKKLQQLAESLDKLVKEKGSDEAISKTLFLVHDEFHNIVGLCSNPD